MSFWYPWSSDRGYLGMLGGIAPYASLNLTQSSPPQSFTEVLSVEQVYNFLRTTQPAAGSDDFVQMQMWISAAREQAEILQNKELVTKQLDLSMDYWMGYAIELRSPLKSVDKVQYTDYTGTTTTLVQNTDYFVDTNKHPGIITPPYGKFWPSYTPAPSSAVLVRHTSGYAITDPFWNGPGARIKAGMLMLISGWFNNRIAYELGSASAAEYPYAITSCLSYGALPRVR